VTHADARLTFHGRCLLVRRNSTGPHLHFEAWITPEPGSALDPVPWLAEHGVEVWRCANAAAEKAAPASGCRYNRRSGSSL